MLRARASSPREGWTCSRLYLEQVRDLAKLLSLSQAEPRSRTWDQSTEPMAREPILPEGSPGMHGARERQGNRIAPATEACAASDCNAVSAPDGRAPKTMLTN